jgi:arylsulfatase A-like enzyme
MSMRSLVHFLCLFFALSLHASDRPNFIFILIDDMGWKDVGFAGSNMAPTPNIDVLAKKGLIFKQAYASAPNCAPTRACLMTGQYTPRHGIYTVIDDRHTPGSPQQKIMAAESKSELPSNTLTLADILKSNGYSTGMVGMWNLGRGKTGPASPLGRGFQYFTEPKALGFEKDTYLRKDGSELTDVMTDAAIKWMTEHKDGPFFLYFAPHAVHAPFEPKPELLAKYADKKDQMAAEYSATIECLDQNIGKLYAELEKLGLTKNTHIFFTSDNGGTRQFNAPLRDGKGSLYEGGIRVPAFWNGPGVKEVSMSEEPVSSIDFLPTLLELAGVPSPTNQIVDGRSLVPIRDGKGFKSTNLFWHFPCYTGNAKPGSAIRQRNWKLIEFFETGKPELYDLSSDPSESKDLSVANTEKTDLLLKTLHDWQKETGAAIPSGPNPNYDPNTKKRPREDR